MDEMLAKATIADAAARLSARARDEDLALLLSRGGDFVHLALSAMRRRLDAPEPRAAREALAALLPTDALGGAPEASILSAELHRRLARWRRGPLPPWREAALPTVVALEWLRAAIVSDAATLAAEPYGELLLQALAADDLDDVVDPLEHVRALAHRDEHALASAALVRTRRFLHQGGLGPEEARSVLEHLAVGPHDDVAAAAWLELAEPWALVLPTASALSPASVLARGADDAVVDAVLVHAARSKLDALLRGCLTDTNAPLARRRHALELYGTVAGRGDADVAFAVGEEDAIAFGGAVMAFLRACHRRGLFLVPADAARLAALALADEGIDAREVAAIGFPVRHELARALDCADPDDEAWPRRVVLLVALANGPQGSQPIEVGPRFEAVLRSTRSSIVRRAMLAGIERVRFEPAEAAVLEELDAEPEATLGALRAVGGGMAVDALTSAIDRPALAPFRVDALRLAWHLTATDPARRKALRERLRTDDDASLRALAKAEDETARVRALGDDVRHATPSRFLHGVTRVAGPNELGLVLDLVLRVVSDIDASAAPNDDARTLPEADRSALGAMGARLVKAGTVRPAIFLDCVGDPSAFFVSACARVLLERPDLTDDETFALLRLLDPKADARAMPLLARAMRRREPQIRKVVIERLARHGAEDFLTTLVRRLDADDIQTLRQAILAIGGLGRRAHPASDALASCLDHPNMNVKKAAADALAQAGGPGAVTKLLFWLGHHDNPGLRASIVAALNAILGPAFVATLVAAARGIPADADDRERTETLLLQALGPVLSIATARSLCARGDAFAARLTRMIVDEEIAFQDVGAFLVELDAHVRTPLPRVDDRRRDPSVRSLLDHGYDESAVIAVSGGWAAIEAADRRALRPHLSMFVQRMSESAAAIDLVVRLAGIAPPSPAEAELLARHLDALLGALPASPDEVSSLLAHVVPVLTPEERLSVARAVRAMPVRPDAGEPLALLTACGVLLDRRDVDRALEATRRTPDPRDLERRVLERAFGIASVAPHPALLAAIRECDLARAKAEAKPRVTLAGELIGAFVLAPDEIRRPLLDWIEAVQPIGAPPWYRACSLAEAEERRREAALHRAGRVTGDGLDGPRSAALRARLVAMLASPDQKRRDRAAAYLARDGDRAALRVLAEAFLRGAIDATSLSLTRQLADVVDVEALRGASPPQLALLSVASLSTVVGVANTLLDALGGAADDERAAILRVLRRLGSDGLVPFVAPRIMAGEWSLAVLLVPPMRATPALEALVARATRDGYDEVARRLSAIVHPRGPDPETFAAELARARVRVPREAVEAVRPSRAELFADAESGDVTRIRRALTLLAEDPDDRLRQLLRSLVGHRLPQVRLHSHRLLRAVGSRDEYLEATESLLGDELPDVRRTAIRVVGFGRHSPAIPKLVDLLADDEPVVRRAAEEAVARFGAEAESALRKAERRARPDKREPFRRALERLEATSE